MSRTLLGPAENSRIIITTNNNNNTWSHKTLNGCLTRTFEDPTVDQSPSTPEMPASSSRQQMPSSSSSISSSGNVKAAASFAFSSPSKSDAGNRPSMANGRLLLAMATSSSSSSSLQNLEAISSTSPSFPLPSSSTSSCNVESNSPNSDDHPVHLALSSSLSPKASSSMPEVLPPAPSASQTSSSSSSPPQTSRLKDVSLKLPSSASLSSCLTTYLSIKSSPSFSPYTTAPSSGIPSPSSGRPESPLEDSPTPGVSGTLENCEEEEESKHSNLEAPRGPNDTSLSPGESKETLCRPKIQTEEGGCRRSCSREDDTEKQKLDDSKVFSAGLGEDSAPVVGPGQTRPAEGTEGRSDGPCRSKHFAQDPLLALSMGQFAHTPFSTMVSLSTSPQAGARQLSSHAGSSSIKNAHSSPFGGFLAKLKDALPGRGSTSDLSKSSRLEKSTTALILQERQPGLPSKAPDEDARHRAMYDNIVEEVKKKEKREARKNMDRVKNQLKMEDLMSSALKVWKRDLLPYWDDVRNNYNTRQLWWHGIPPSIRGLVWKLVIGNDLNITKELYEICLQRFQELLRTASSSSSSSSSSTSASPSLTKVASKSMSPSSSSSSLPTKQVGNGPALLSTADGKERDNPVSRESSVELIRLDVSRTFPSLCIFQKVGPYHEYLEGLLGAYVCYRPDVGYVQGMSFVAAILLLNMEAHDAFICFANLLNRPIFIAFFRLDADMMKVYFNTYNFCFKNNLPKLYKHFLEQKLTADLYIIDWVFSLYSKCFNLDIVSRIWDVFFRDGEQFLFRTALGILKLFQPILMNMDFIQMAQFLVRPPESQVDQAELFHSIESIDMECRGLTFRQVLEQFKVSQLTGQH